MFTIFTIFLGFLIFFALAPRSNLHVVRIKSAREDAMHDQIQQAMNWRPEHFHQREDGRWFNAYGQEGVSMTLEESIDKYCKKEDQND